MITLNKLKKDPEIVAFITQADKQLAAIGYTEHGSRHARLVAKNAKNILLELGYEEKIAELAAIAGYLHDIGNVVSRERHEQTSAIIAKDILNRLGLPPKEIAEIISALGNHHEETGMPISNLSAALILADKADVHRSRVRNPEFIKFDIHDRVNFAVKRSTLTVNKKDKKIIFDLSVDTNIAPVMEYFEIFLSRMLISQKAADFLKCKFELVINGNKLI
ncbi:MAG: HD domain-containing protein [bacterium]|nr:HD domain-containing protein [candidate division WOR-3 bacterium]MDH5683802.1 HD domain-containing protein [candidate division WOR-3 bacterium]